MSKPKYFDYTKNQPINIEQDGCDLAEWGRLYEDFRFARHPKGFNIFLPPDKLDASDEYSESDPYTLESDIESDFHRRRVELTLDLVTEAVSSIKDSPQILDLGCGQGHITERIRQAVNAAQISGLDYSVSAVEYAHKNFPQIDFAVGDAYDSPYARQFFDVVVCNNLWEHVPDPLFLLNRVKQVIKPGGYLIVSTPSRYRLGNMVNVIMGKPVKFLSKFHVTEYTVGQVEEQLTYGGFKVKRIISRPISARSIKGKVAKWVLSQLISMVGSHHQIEATVFYLAQESTRTAEPSS
ncbi:MAG: methyltransferase domain-containing protein [Thiohalocapsa sp. PB-PSB1]|jgi:2-polyprenyl-3-methyl-5-hydroxy-6-metoxy-1,4-benzoquinol methylase|nr:MAG: hypothetical protein N838_25685 [Thiohalocapsa sp. PB-PSB1]QQO52425.1 MAG: methyltransferase domain-containing protein [Thiohalocapsa sp. PB-PSB1]HCS92119.1 class I SAM-dependent methyltransferase [Chromatiaceae bacterium]